MQVVATRDGFFGGKRRRAGTKFTVPDGSKAAWFVQAVEYVAPEAPAAEVNTLSGLNKVAAAAAAKVARKEDPSVIKTAGGKKTEASDLT